MFSHSKVQLEMVEFYVQFNPVWSISNVKDERWNVGHIEENVKGITKLYIF